MEKLIPYFLAIASNMAFGTASIAFAGFSKTRSPQWINQLKVSVGFIGFLIAFLVLEHWVQQPIIGTGYLLFSGFMGLCVGDLFLFRAFATLGAARTLVLYSFQPFLLGMYGWAFLNQSLSIYQFAAILCMVVCVFTFLLEQNQLTGKWNLLSFSYAFLGIVFDALGVMLSRQAYETTPALGSFQANLLRATGALIGFFVIRPASFIALWNDLRTMVPKERRLAIGASILGTFISLSLYLRALKTAHVATLTAISITGPVWVSMIEHGRDRKWPNRYLWVAFFLFLTGFTLMAWK